MWSSSCTGPTYLGDYELVSQTCVLSAAEMRPHSQVPDFTFHTIPCMMGGCQRLDYIWLTGMGVLYKGVAPAICFRPSNGPNSRSPRKTTRELGFRGCQTCIVYFTLPSKFFDAITISIIQ